MYSIYLLRELIMTDTSANAHQGSVTCSLLLLLPRLLNLPGYSGSVPLLTRSVSSRWGGHKHDIL